MPQSSLLRFEDGKKIHQIAAECRDLGDDPIVWRRHFFECAAKLVNGDVVIGGEMADCLTEQPRDLGATDWGFEAGFNRRGWLQALKEFAENSGYDPAMVQYQGILADDDGACVARDRLIADREWYGSAVYEIVHASVGTDAAMYCFHQLPENGTDFSGMVISRSAGKAAFSEHECRLVRELHDVITPLIGGSLARFNEPAPYELPPRVRQVLRCLLEGDSDKQIACRLKLSPHTVNQYTKTIYKHFGTSGRAELLARWIRRGWNSRCGWE